MVQSRIEAQAVSSEVKALRSRPQMMRGITRTGKTSRGCRQNSILEGLKKRKYREHGKPAFGAVGIDKVQELRCQIQELKGELARAREPLQKKEKEGKKGEWI